MHFPCTNIYLYCLFPSRELFPFDLVNDVAMYHNYTFISQTTQHIESLYSTYG